MDPGVGRRDEHIRIVDGGGAVVGHRQVVVLESLSQRVVGLEVELVDEQDVWPDPLDDLRDGCRLRVAWG